jgi:Zn-dependent protease
MKLLTVFKTRFRIHYTWLLVFILIPWTITTQYSTETALTARVLLGVATALLFFCTVFCREMALLILANIKGIVVKTVTIFAFGGLIQPDYETTYPSHVTLLAVSGMLLNFAITVVFYFAHLLFLNIEQEMISVLLKWLAFFFFTLGLFHIIPAYPLEGGRILRGIFWKATDDIRRATRIAGIISWVIGLLTLVSGILLAVLTDELFTGLFFIALGLIIQNAATHGVRHMKQIPEPESPQPPSGDSGESEEDIAPLIERIQTQQLPEEY